MESMDWTAFLLVCSYIREDDHNERTKNLLTLFTSAAAVSVDSISANWSMCTRYERHFPHSPSFGTQFPPALPCPATHVRSGLLHNTPKTFSQGFVNFLHTVPPLCPNKRHFGSFSAAYSLNIREVFWGDSVCVGAPMK